MDEQDRLAMARQLFAWLTMRLEDASALGLEGQSKSLSLPDATRLAGAIQYAVEEIRTVTAAVVALLR